MGRRTLLLLAALVVAALGTTGVFLYVNGIDKRAEASYDVVRVLVAKTAIPVGTSAQDAQDSGSLELRPFIRKSVEGLPALSDITGIASKVALSPIAAGSPILETQFGAPGDSSVLPIPEGKVAVSVELTDPARVAGFVGPGSEVAVFLTTTDSDGVQETTRTLLERVQVIASGATTLVTTTTENADGQQTDELPKAILTLALDQVEAQKIVYGSQNGDMYFALLREDSQIDKSKAGTTAENLFD